MVANPAHGQKTRENYFFFVPVRAGSVRLKHTEVEESKHFFVTFGKEQKKKKKKENKKEEGEHERRRSAELGNTKETLGVPTSLNTFPTTAVAPYWINQRLQSKMYHQTSSLHRNERHRCASCAGSSNNS